MTNKCEKSLCPCFSFLCFHWVKIGGAVIHLKKSHVFFYKPTHFWESVEITSEDRIICFALLSQLIYFLFIYCMHRIKYCVSYEGL